MDFAQTHWHATAQTPLSAAQLLTLLNKIFVLRVARAQETLAIPPVQAPPASPWLVLKKPWVIVAAIVVLALLWLVI
jgi:hypothetical protein